MNLTRRVTVWFLTLILAFGLMSQTVFAEETTASSLQGDVTEEISEEGTENLISKETMEDAEPKEDNSMEGSEPEENKLDAETGTGTDIETEGASATEATKENIPEEEVLEEKKAEDEKGIKYIHLNMHKGNDINDGLTEENSVASFEKAKSLLKDGDIILLDSYVEIKKDEIWDLSDKPNSKLQRNAGGDMVVVEGNYTLTLSNIVLDGKPYSPDIDLELCNSIISLGKSAGGEANGAKLVLNSGAVLENNNAPQQQGNAIAGYSYNTITMNENSIIRDNGIENGAQFGGGIHLENHGKFIMNGGLIENNHAVRGGGVCLIASSMEMYGGTIKNNSANSKDTYAGHYGGGSIFQISKIGQM